MTAHMGWWRRAAREPLLHFLAIGGALFLLSAVLGSRSGAGDNRIVVTSGQVESLIATFMRTWQRPPTRQELDGLIESYVKDEVYAREAVALGLDKEDTIIRRRLRQKMEFISEEALQTEPTEGDLRQYLQKHPAVFREPGRVSFRHVYISPDRRGAAARADAQRLLTTLRARDGAFEAADLGDRLPLPETYEDTSVQEIGGLFGSGFAETVSKLPIGQWQGPVESGYGYHLVLVANRAEARTPRFEDVQDAVRREWSNTRRLEANDAFYRGLRERYRITVEPWPRDEKKAAPGKGRQRAGT